LDIKEGRGRNLTPKPLYLLGEGRGEVSFSVLSGVYIKEKTG
jgi:hypothetical protein